MDTSEFRIRDYLHGGASNVRTTFWKDDYSTTDTKYQERQKVLRFILESVGRFPADYKKIRLLSLPGLNWFFENSIRTFLLDTNVSNQFIGLEINPTLYAKSKLAIPGMSGHRVVSQMQKYGNAEFEVSQIENSFSPSATGQFNKLLLMDVETYVTMICTDYGANQQEKLDFSRHFLERNAVWLDFNSPLTRSIENTLRWLPFSMHSPSHKGGYEKPVVITVLNGRDSFQGDEERVERMIWAQSLLKYVKHWTYIGKGGVSMLTACFTVR